MICKSDQFLYDNKYDIYPYVKDSIERILSFYADGNFDLENPRYNRSIRQAYKQLGWNEYKSFDVICSFWTSFQSLLTALFEDSFKYDKNVFKYKTVYGWNTIGKKALSSKFLDKKNTNCRPLLTGIPDECKEEIDHFAGITHSIANYMPCFSSSFNYVKGTHTHIRDFLPMMVDQIQSWKDDYKTEQNDKVVVYEYETTVNGITYTKAITVKEVRLWHQWLVDNCECYKLSMYYTVMCNKDNIKVKGIPLFSGQSINNPLPKSKDEVIECIRNMNKCICQRARLLMINVE